LFEYLLLRTTQYDLVMEFTLFANGYPKNWALAL
jgi:hypothetical protein